MNQSHGNSQKNTEKESVANDGEASHEKADAAKPSGQTLWDERLDYLREHRLAPWTEVVVAWMVAMLCLAYYAYSYLSLCLATTSKDGNNADFFPLVTQPKGRVESRSAADLYQQVLRQLGDVDLADDKNSSNQLAYNI